MKYSQFQNSNILLWAVSLQIEINFAIIRHGELETKQTFFPSAASEHEIPFTFHQYIIARDRLVQCNHMKYEFRFACDLKLIHALKRNWKYRKLHMQNRNSNCIFNAN